jgi:type I restriction enzyme M protein
VSITQTELEHYLGGAATILRGTIDAGDYKQFIFPLLFFKRISDVWDEEYQQALADSDGDVDYATFAENHRFQLPPGSHWSDLRAVTTNVGAALQRSMREIEQANPARLAGVFGDAQWTNKERLSDATLRDLVEHFSKHTLSTANVPEDEFGQGYEYLIKRFADDSGHTAQEFYTNRTLVHLMTLILDPQPGESVYDPTCGTGGMLLSAVAKLKRGGKEYRNLKLFGQELNLMSSSIARMNLFLHGIVDFDIRRGDTLSEPLFLAGDQLQRFDVILANPPYSIKRWDRTAWISDPYGRNHFGAPPQGRADYAFFQHILASMKEGLGRCAILFPHGVLFRDEESAMRSGIVDADLVEGVIGLGPGLFYNSPMEACIVICRESKPPERRGKIVFVNAVAEYAREGGVSTLRQPHLDKIVSAYTDWRAHEDIARIVDLDEVLENGGNLNLELYVPRAMPGGGPESPDLATALGTWTESGEAVREAAERLWADELIADA